MKSLVLLYLSHNALSGTLPIGLNAFTQLKELWLDNNALTGKLPEQWCPGLSSLVTLALYGNRFSGSIPSSWPTCMKHLHDLGTFNNSKLSGCVPAAYQGLLLRPLELKTGSPSAALQAQRVKVVLKDLTDHTLLSGFCPK
jgi:hypothetical protein